MLIKLTEKCSMGCNHCISDCKVSGKDMDVETFKDTLKFLDRNLSSFPVLLLSGGEPLESEYFDQIMEELIAFQKKTFGRKIKVPVTIVTNGTQLEKNPEKYIKLISDMKRVGIDLRFQVTTDKRYYPYRINVNKSIFKHKNVCLCIDPVDYIYPLGRALTNNIPAHNYSVPQCFNLKSNVKKGKSLKEVVKAMEFAGKFCCPQISPNGEIKLGESSLCPSIGTIYDSMSTIESGIRNLQCSKCDHIIDNMSPQLKAMW